MRPSRRPTRSVKFGNFIVAVAHNLHVPGQHWYAEERVFVPVVVETSIARQSEYIDLFARMLGKKTGGGFLLEGRLRVPDGLE